MPRALVCTDEEAADTPAECRHCGWNRLQKWGRARGRLRYRCIACGRTCSIRVQHDGGAVSRRLHAQRELLLSMLAPASVRETARLLALRPRTVLAYRHRVLRVLASAPTPPQTGEMIIVRVPVLVHGTRARLEPFSLLVLLARHTGARRVLAASLNPSTHEMEWLLREHVGAGATIVYARGSLGAVGTAARRLGLRYIPAKQAQPPEEWKALRVAAWTYGAAIRQWLMQFHGIRTERTQHYIAWYEALATARQAADHSSAWLALCEQALHGRSGSHTSLAKHH